MPRYSAFFLAFILTTSMHAIPLDEIAARDGVSTASTDILMGNQGGGGSVAAEAASCSSTNCTASRHSDESVLKAASGEASDAFSDAANAHSLFPPGPHSTNSIGETPQGSEPSGAGDKAKGVLLADNYPALIGLNSGNARQSGNETSRNSSGLVNQPGDVEQKGHKILTS